MKTTLEDAGFSSGNGVLRLLYKFVSTTLKETMINIQEGKQRHNVLSSTEIMISIGSRVEKVENQIFSEKQVVQEDKEVLDDVMHEESDSSVIATSTVDKTDESLSLRLDRQITVFKPIPDNFTMPKCNCIFIIKS